MTRSAERMVNGFVSMQTDDVCSEAVITLRDGSRLCFRHRVGERWAKAIGPLENENAAGTTAHELLDETRMFRLNAKHLEITFRDGSVWQEKPG